MSKGDQVYTINTRSGDIAVQLRKVFDDIFARRTFEKVSQRVNTAVDREISKIFQRVAVNILNTDFREIDPYIPTPWRPYAKNYTARKLRQVGHLDWFKYGYRNRARDGQPTLADFLKSMDPESVLEVVGETRTTLSRDKKRITISLAPHLRFSRNNMEKQFADSGLIDEEQMYKLQNVQKRRRAYRALIGPEFQFMLNDRIPQVISKALRT